MKKSIAILFVLLSFTLSYAQTGPSKQQTINELNNQQWKASYWNYYNSRKGYYQDIGRQDQKDNHIHSKTSFAIKNISCVLEVTIKYQEADTWVLENAPIQTKTVEIDMSKVIRIESRLANVDAFEGFDIGIGSFTRGWILTFVLVDENFRETKKIELVQFNSLFDTDADLFQTAEYLKENKPYKVLNHLRKLCNAPEPLSWD